MTTVCCVFVLCQLTSFPYAHAQYRGKKLYCSGTYFIHHRQLFHPDAAWNSDLATYFIQHRQLFHPDAACNSDLATYFIAELISSNTGILTELGLWESREEKERLAEATKALFLETWKVRRSAQPSGQERDISINM